MGGVGSGRKPNMLKKLIGSGRPINPGNSLYLPNLSGVKHELKEGVSGITTDDVNEGTTNEYSKWDRTGTTLSPKTANDDVELNQGSLNAEEITATSRSATTLIHSGTVNSQPAPNTPVFDWGGDFVPTPIPVITGSVPAGYTCKFTSGVESGNTYNIVNTYDGGSWGGKEYMEIDSLVTLGVGDAFEVYFTGDVGGTVDADISSTIDTLTIAGGSITDTTGTIDFGNENLTTAGTGTFNALTTTEFKVASNGDTWWEGSGTGLPYGELYVYNNTTADSLSTGTWTQMTRFDTAGQSNLVTVSTANDDLTITKAGVYQINVSASFSGSGSVTFYGGVWKNNGATQLTNLQIHRKLGAAGDVGCVSMSGFADLAANDTLEIWIRQDSGVSKNITIQDCCLSCVMVGGT